MAVIEYAFKCVNCGALEEPQQAGELDRPTKCHVCGKGAHFDTDTGVRILDPDNWIILADLSDKDMKALNDFHQFDPKLHKIVRATPIAPADPDRVPVTHNLTAEENLGGEDVVQQ